MTANINVASWTTRIVRLASAASLALAVSACGGDNGVAEPDRPTNAAPVVEAAQTSLTTPENSMEPLTTITASDPNGDAVTLSLAGADAALFSLDAETGVLSFATAPDFETPGDAGADNLYAVNVVGRDGNGGTAQVELTVEVTDLVPLPSFTEIASGFAAPTLAEELPGTGGQLLVLEKGGRTRLLDPETGEIAAEDFLTFDDISSEGEGGVLGFAVAPDYDSSRQIYFHVNNLAGDTEIRRYTLADGSQTRADASSVETIIVIGQPRNNHNAGSIGFDTNGYLVVPMGDGGGAGDPQRLAQNTQSLLGKVLRLDITGDDYPNDALRNYAIPPGNTFTDAADGRPEIFAIGLRNPFRSSFDPTTGDLLIADVGQDEREEINRLPMDDSSLNFGWSVREGSLPFGTGSAPDFTLPIAEYEHGNGPTQGNSITGGVVYDGESDVLDQAYVFADFSSANIWAIPADTQTAATPLFGDDFRRVNDDLLLGSARPSGVVSFSVDSQNRLFVTTIGGRIYRLDELE